MELGLKSVELGTLARARNRDQDRIPMNLSWGMVVVCEIENNVVAKRRYLNLYL